ncbi:hypothetical protein EW146_g9345, partial [Bondarzewia mesenterica]
PVEGALDKDADIPLTLDISPVEETVNEVLADEVSTFLRNEQGSMLSTALEEAAERRQAQFSLVDELLGLDEEELDAFLLSEEEVRIKERVWVEMNKEYLEAIALKGEQRETGASATKSRKRRKVSTNPRDASTPHGNTAAESVRSLLKKSAKYSKRINYNALKDLFDGDDKDDDHQLYTMEDDKEEDGVVVEEAGGGAVGRKEEYGGDEDAEGDEEGSEKGDEYGWEDAYEQEI